MVYETGMSDQTRRFLESTLQASATATFIATDSLFVGNIRGRGQFVVFGEVQGDGDLEGGLNLSATGRWIGTIRAHEAIVAGTILGELEVAGKLEIGCTAVIRGSISARAIAIAKGAIVDGELVVTSGTAIIEFEEKRESR
jgi:cytoskeletal protein CcmA (bactofilin family)